jgi:DNA-binding NarL/FixJ family response regulator
MAHRATAVLVTEQESTASRLVELTEGSQIHVLGATGFTDRGKRKVAKRPPDVVLVDGNTDADVYLPFIRDLAPRCPGSAIVLLSDDADITVMARAAISGFTAACPPHLPQAALIRALLDCKEGRPPEPGAAFERVRGALGRPPAPDATLSDSDLRTRALACHQMGLDASDIALFLSASSERIRTVFPTTPADSGAKSANTQSRLTGRLSSGGLVGAIPQLFEPEKIRAYGRLAAVLLCAYAAWSVISWLRSPAPLIAVRGEVSFHGSPLERGEIEFAPKSGGPAQRRSASIVGGLFELPSHRGLIPKRQYAIKINGYLPTGRTYDNAEGSEPSPEYDQVIPPSFNTQSSLTLDTSGLSVTKELTLDIP